MTGAPAFSLTFDRHPAYLVAHVTGERTRENGVRFLEEVHQALAAAGLRRVLCDVDFVGPFMPASILQVIQETHFEGSRLERVAYMERNMGADSARFVELMASNRGVNVRFFADRAAAIAWLAGP